jgi:hypothetical protein
MRGDAGLVSREGPPSPDPSMREPLTSAVEDVEVRGHIIDSLILPEILDCTNPSTAIKLTDRGMFRTAGLVTDVAPFLRAPADKLAAQESTAN